mmetsp:Transcript_2387/g.5677  ORF Transcript_2387/g.5677 Transcript_2387/m.5677 type:complete len:356 (-) Transcript_2387:136-1203(-)|eukprot:CAMPEP_0114548464 /NCGR_PEP_ID=MMETSP0114-20121206/4993_1 /TAXON_ID=31324 /ORGANISM="Goniomonas sp, Strain m" /LENGTH=355 /DNA_ID=CAMNT_0001733051 /DNA_START=28 /DNA_END=1095 /DNA_ORIENTATION=-
MADDARRAAAEANAAFVDEEYETAVEKYNLAVQLEPSNPEFLLNRAAVHLKLENHMDAVSDCNAAIKLDPSNSKAFLRKGMACFHLEEFATAKAAFEAGQKLDSGNATYKTWLRKCAAELDTEDSQPTAAAPAAATNVAPASTAAAAASPAVVAPPPKKVERFRHDFIQNAQFVTVTVYIKGSTKENCIVEFGPQHVELERVLAKDDTWQMALDLCKPIVPEESTVNYLSTKVEIKMKKQSPGKWDSLETVEILDDEVVAAAKRDMYPSSKGERNWDKIVGEIPEDKPEGDEALNKFFQELYGKSSEETRRAMNKSFVESGGTVLSTNWSEVGVKPVEGTPPEGLEMRKWSDLGK